MQTRRFLTTMAAMSIAVIGAPPLLGAQIGVQRERNVPTAFAITNARIVPVAGPVIARGTVVIRDGVIAAVGASAQAPADARIIDGTGLTVYPGLIDANSSIGYPVERTVAAATPGRGGRGGRGGGGAAQQGSPAGAPNSLQPVGLQPELAAADLVKPEPDAFAGPQSAGITTALTVPASGIFRGLSAMINLDGATSQAMIVKTPVAEHIGFTPTRGAGYPGSLLGVFSALRQQLLDAQHYAAVQAAYAKNPRSMRRPESDPSLEALQPVLNKQIPVVLMASSVREIERALDLAKEFGLRPIIAGGEEADQIAARLKAENVPVLLSLNFPRRPAASPDADPEPLRVLRARVEAPTLAAKLAKAGVRFAFEDGGMTNWSDFLGNVKRSVEGGLTQDQAVRALTASPAEILGVSDRLGTIEVGKVANLTLTRGDLFTGRIAQLFIDGNEVEVRPQAGNGGAMIANGTWTITVTTEDGERPVTLSITQVGDQLRGTIQGALGNSQISNGTVSADGSVKFSATVTLGGNTEEGNFAGTISANVIRGTMSVVGHPQSTFVGSKPAGAGNGRRGRPPASSVDQASAVSHRIAIGDLK
jgi:Imidazolonepropionase and related amidohydrolases